jgi:putative transposase
VLLDLREAGETCFKRRVARLMREHRLRALHGYRTPRWAVGKPAVLILNLLQRQFTVSRPNKSAHARESERLRLARSKQP